MDDQILKVQMLQSLISWHKPNENLDHMGKLVSQSGPADLIVLPEMWNTGFTMKAALYHKYAEEALKAMKSWSTSYRKTFIGSMIVEEDGKYYNRLYAVKQGEVIASYDKRHLFAFSGEDRHFQSGERKILLDLSGWTFCLNICYDLRFPVWSRNMEDYDVLLYVANWPDARIDAWKSLLKARAIENQCYVVGVNCFGKDAWNNQYSGHSYAFSFDGHAITEYSPGENIFEFELDKRALIDFRSKFPFLRERDAIEGNWSTDYFTDSK